MEFEHRHKARGALQVFGIAAFAVFALLALVLGDGGLKLFGVIFAAIAGAMAFSAWKKEEWLIHIESDALTWCYPPRWAPAAGSISLAEVARAEINDDLSMPAITVTMKSGETQKVLLFNSGFALSQHLSSRYPHIATSYIPSKSGG